MQMPEKNIRNRSSLFLMETVIVIFFFAITCVICIRIFVRSYILSETSSELTKSSLWADNMSQVFYSSGGDLDQILDTFCEYSVALAQEGTYEGTLLICFDKDWQPISHPASDIDTTIANTCYELILTEKLEDAATWYKDYSTSKRSGYAVAGNIYIYDVALSDELITEIGSVTTDNAVFSLPVDIYIGDVSIDSIDPARDNKMQMPVIPLPAWKGAYPLEYLK